MTNTVTPLPTIIINEGIPVPVHTLILIAAVFLAICIIIFALVRIWQRRRNPGIVLPRRLMLGTAAMVLALGLIDALFVLAYALEVSATVADPNIVYVLFNLSLAQQLRFLCLPLLIAAIAYILSLAMKK